MIRTTFIYLIIAAIVSVLAFGSYYLSTLSGGVQYDLFGHTGSISVLLTVLLLIVLSAVLMFALAILLGLIRLPWILGRSATRRKKAKANKSLTEGLLAAEAGDVRSAQIHAKKALKHADDERLKLLLEARIAEAQEDWLGAERAWGMLTRLPGGELAGLRGAAAAAIERGDKGSAEANAKQALLVKSTATWPFAALFDLQVSRHEWAQALETLSVGEKRKLIDGDSLRRRKAVLETARAVNLPANQTLEAQRLLASALKACPGFPPAVWHGAKHLIRDNKLKAAFGVIELGWQAGPHPALARLARQITSADTRSSATRKLTSLAQSNLNHRESRILLAQIAAERGKWAETIRGLAVLVEEEPTARLCLLMEQALHGYGDEKEAVRWGRMAVTAAREADWSDLDPKGGAFAYSDADWSRLVYKFGDAGQLVHPRYEAFGRELDATRPAQALPNHGKLKEEEDSIAPLSISAPIDYVPPASKAAD